MLQVREIRCRHTAGKPVIYVSRSDNEAPNGLGVELEDALSIAEEIDI
jgi:hypothetical protein